MVKIIYHAVKYSSISSHEVNLVDSVLVSSQGIPLLVRCRDSKQIYTGQCMVSVNTWVSGPSTVLYRAVNTTSGCVILPWV